MRKPVSESRFPDGSCPRGVGPLLLDLRVSDGSCPRVGGPLFCILSLFLRLLALETVTAGSASKFHAERSGREILGSHSDPFRTLFGFQLRPPISGEHFLEPAP